MAGQTYFIIHNSDGDTHVDVVTESELRERLKVEDGANYYGRPGFLNKADIVERGPDTNYWGDNLVIIKGEVIVPKPKEVVTEWEV